MWKLLAITALASSLVQAGTSDEKVVDFIERSFDGNPNIKSMDVDVIHKTKLEKPKGWEAFIVNIDATLKKKDRKVNQKMIWFTNGEVITQDLLDIKTTSSLKDIVSPKFKDEYYSDSNLIYGNKNAKNKVVIFSDPLCPFCRRYVPEALAEMKSRPDTFAVYYYHFPLPSLHPAAIELTKAAIALELKTKRKDIVLDLYKVEINSKERDVNKILAAFNKTMKADIKPSDIKSPKVLKHFENDQKMADSLLVQGTPTVFFNGEKDKSKNKYKDVE